MATREMLMCAELEKRIVALEERVKALEPKPKKGKK